MVDPQIQLEAPSAVRHQLMVVYEYGSTTILLIITERFMMDKQTVTITNGIITTNH